MSGPVRKRSEVPAGECWDLSRIFPSLEAWEAEMTALAADHHALDAWRGRLGESAATLLRWFEVRDPLHRRLEAVFLYPRLAYQEDLTDSTRAARSSSCMRSFLQRVVQPGPGKRPV